MDGVILAGGKGTRMRPLTLDRPKPLLELQGQPILAWSLLSLQGIVDHVLIVVSYLQEQIERFMADQDLIPAYTLVEQLPEPMGTGHALQTCQKLLRGDGFLVINGDDLYSREALRQLANQEFSILSMLRDDFDQYGVVVHDEAGRFLRIDEKPPRSRYRAPVPCNIGAYKFKTQVFDYDLPISERGEYEISDYVGLAAGEHVVSVVDSPFWLPIGDPAALEAAQQIDIKRWIAPPSG
ncbi:MAG: sugar phosphate nucleotidyltransferase [Chloroflexota bacterium]|nr:sugar phosphate nucleotidyltransferase [Chloroflexota bacterium]